MIEAITVETDVIKLKFNETPRVSDLTNDKFTLSLEDATPSGVEDPFELIILKDHYKSVPRILYLFFNDALESGRLYTLTVTGIKDPYGRDLGTFTRSFVSGDREEEDDDPEEIETVIDLDGPEFSHATPAPTEVEDHSIVANVFTSTTTTPFNPEFYISSIDPRDSMVDVDEDNGRITVKFNTLPNVEFLSSTYFRIQRKALNSATRWESLPVLISVDGSRPWVYVSLPSTDDEPVYNTDDSEYYEPGYKYRLKISKDIGV